MKENLEDYFGVKASASERRILMKKWCGEACESISRSSVVRRFEKCGLSTNVDGCENHEVCIEKIPDYQMPLDDDEFSKECTLDGNVESDDGDGGGLY